MKPVLTFRRLRSLVKKIRVLQEQLGDRGVENGLPGVAPIAQEALSLPGEGRDGGVVGIVAPTPVFVDPEEMPESLRGYSAGEMKRMLNDGWELTPEEERWVGRRLGIVKFMMPR